MALLSVWQYLGSGYVNPGDVLFGAGVQVSLRAAREAMLDLRPRTTVGGVGCSLGGR
jgi:hypothetical protein